MKGNSSNVNNKKFIIPLLIVGVMFFIIGFGIGISGFLTPALKSAFDLTNVQSYLVTAAIFSAFVIFGGPAGYVIKRLGYRKAMFIAFFIMGMGMLLFVPSSIYVSFPLFLLALFIGGIGNTLLQAAVNPYVTILGSHNSAATRMCFMGIMNKAAWWLAPLFLGVFIDLNHVNIDDVILPFYIVTGILIVLGIFIVYSPLPEIQAEGENEAEIEGGNNEWQKTSVFQYPHLLLGVLALFLYVGIETLPMASIIDFAKASFGNVDNLQGYSKYVSIGLVIGYLFGLLAIPKLLSQTQALIIFSAIGVVSSLLLIYSPAEFAFYALLLVSFANSLMWPSIWPLAIADLGKHTKSGSSLLVMGIVGGAVIPMIFGFLVDTFKGVESQASVANFQSAYWVLVPCYIFILYYSLWGHKIRK